MKIRKRTIYKIRKMIADSEGLINLMETNLRILRRNDLKLMDLLADHAPLLDKSETCIHCADFLVIGMNWTENQRLHSDYRCKTCRTSLILQARLRRTRTSPTK